MTLIAEPYYYCKNCNERLHDFIEVKRHAKDNPRHFSYAKVEQKPLGYKFN